MDPDSLSWIDTVQEWGNSGMAILFALAWLTLGATWLIGKWKPAPPDPNRIEKQYFTEEDVEDV